MYSANGRGLSFPLSSFEASIQHNSLVQFVDIARNQPMDSVKSATYVVDTAYSLTVTTKSGGKLPTHIQEITYNFLK
ncbi:hypothetical protein DLJ74_00770 [Gracilibacillus dipsosauri]|uniref:Uncharacterized protein n=1 Tax=Gracilibacillus dipsosauri TaxID=178340 RepID=A0A317L998_9BACI|nr:hypothetical protein DLJ74_00770 [Gracilibacillus dipsosauri]